MIAKIRDVTKLRRQHGNSCHAPHRGEASCHQLRGDQFASTEHNGYQRYVALGYNQINSVSRRWLSKVRNPKREEARPQAGSSSITMRQQVPAYRSTPMEQVTRCSLPVSTIARTTLRVSGSTMLEAGGSEQVALITGALEFPRQEQMEEFFMRFKTVRLSGRSCA